MRIALSVAVVWFLGFCCATTLPAAPPTPKTPVILDTDIGDDIDDTWALVMLVKSPQFDVKLVTTSCGKAEYRAKIIAKLLTVAQRTDVPVGLGEGGRTGTGGQEAWVKDYKLSDYPGKIHEDGAAAVIDVIQKSTRPVTVISIGPLHTMAEVLKRQPDLAGRALFAGMYGSVRVGYDGAKKPAPEWNVKANPPACQRVLSAAWRQATITPLDTCGLVRLSGQRFQSLVASRDPLVQALLENYRVWSKKKSVAELKASSVLFDTVAVYLADPAPRTLVQLETLPIRVTDNGMTLIDPAGKKLIVASAWKDLDAYYDLLVKTLLSPTCPAAR